MNIFVLHQNPWRAAQAHCDKHVVKMILETAQILSTVIRKKHPTELLTELYKPTHINHPCVLWAEQSYPNMTWLYNLGMALCYEYKYRYGKVHASKKVIKVCGEIIPHCDYPQSGHTPFTQAMPAQYRQLNAVKAYRNYYKNEKADLLTYTKRPKPLWLG